MSDKNIAIIGGGASGLVAAILLARANFKVSIFEKNSKLGRKILATGNGRCNVTNEIIHSRHYHSKNDNFTDYLLEHFGTKECREFFESIGVWLVKKPTNRYYPMSQQASSIVEALTHELHRLRVSIYLESEVEKLFTCKEKFVLHVKQKEFKFDKLMVATGGVSMKKLGSSGSGYEFAKSFGHSLVSTHPSLVQLVTKEDTKTLSGAKFEGVIKIAKTNISSCGDILFAPYGISGSATLDISRYVGDGGVDVEIDCLPNFSKEVFVKMLSKSIKKVPKMPLSLWLHGFVNKKLALFVLKRCALKEDKIAQEITRKEINALIFTLKNLKFKVTKTKGFEFAEVTAGGVSTKEINPQTLESKLVKNLYFLGEVLDVDGDCGGYNLHFAWGCGYMVAKALQNL